LGMEAGMNFYFNPHTREGCDLYHHKSSRSQDEISIHTPARGVTSVKPINGNACFISIHTPARGVTGGIRD